MRVAFDTNFILYCFDPNFPAPKDPETGNPMPDFRERVEHLVDYLERKKAKIIIPTPALSEALVHADEALQGYIDALRRSPNFQIANFDYRAATEAAIQKSIAIKQGDKRGGAVGPAQKINVDRQIIAITKVAGASHIYSQDDAIQKLAPQCGIEALTLASIKYQARLPLNSPGS